MKVLVACEESQTVTKAFRELGFEAYSCDVQDCSGGHPEWHIKGCALEEAYSGKYELMIAHPPCTYMSKAGARWMYPTAGNICPDRYAKAMDAKDFFLKLLYAPIDFVAVENPTPLKCVGLPKNPVQVIQPYQFGHPYSKRTLLWLKNLPHLQHTDVVQEYKPFLPSNTGGLARGKGGSRGVAHNAKDASVTFTGIAKAMANQWGRDLLRGEK
jgi:hypothetical protein